MPGHVAANFTRICRLFLKNRITKGLLSKFRRIKYKLNVKFSLCLTKHSAMKTYGGVEV
jgi:hypothetical protein